MPESTKLDVEALGKAFRDAHNRLASRYSHRDANGWEFDEHMAQAVIEGIEKQNFVIVDREDAHYLAAVVRDVCDGFSMFPTRKMREVANRVFDAVR